MRRSAFWAGAVFGVVLGAGLLARAALGGSDGVVIPYKGHLDLDGRPVTGVLPMRFDVYNVSTGGTPCASSTQPSVAVYDGVFSVQFPVTPASCVTGQPVWIGTRVNAGTPQEITLSGRQRIFPAVGALTSGTGDFAVQGTLSAAGAAVTGNVSAASFTVGGKWKLADTGDDWFRIYDANTASYRGGLAAGNLWTDGNLNVGGAAAVNGRLHRTEYQISCPQGLSGSHYPYCCRINVRNGVTECRVTTGSTYPSWNTVASPFPSAGADDPYDISCNTWVGGVNYPVCCRIGASGAAECALNNNTSLAGGWTAVSSPF